MLSAFSSKTPPAPDANADPVRDVGLDSFVAEVIDGSRERLVLVSFHSARSAASKQLAPVLEKLARAYKGAIILAKVDIDTYPQIALQMGVQSVPAVFAFFRGQPIDGFMGALPEAQVRNWLERLAKTAGGAAPAADGIDEALKRAGEALAAGDTATAQAIYADILDAEPQHSAAMSGLLRSLIALGRTAEAQTIFTQLPPEIAKDKAFDPVRAALELAAQANAGGDVAGLQAKLEPNPADHQTRFDLAMAYYAAGRREEAVDELLEIVRRARNWNEDAARKQLVKFFEAFGAADPLTISARKRLSSILFA